MDKCLGRILVVDDNSQNLELAEDTLSDAGYEVFLAKSGEEALALTKEREPDVVLLDVMMPGKSGFEVCGEIRPEFEGKIIMLTAKAHTKDKIEGLGKGADDYLTKPYETSELVARVQTQMRTKKAEDTLKTSLSRSEHMAAIGEIVGSVAHDFNNILTELQVFRLLMELLEKAKNSNLRGSPEETGLLLDKATKFCGMAENGITLGQSLTRGLLTFSRGAGNKQDLQPIAPLIKSPLEILERRLYKEDVEVDVDLDEEAPPVRCNDGEIKQLALNLVLNALQAMEKNQKEKKLAVRLWKEEPWVKLAFADTGCGIPTEIRPFIFDALFTTKPPGKGTGIGLSTIKKIITTHHGEIDFTSKENEGTTFTISLPIGE